MIYKVLHKLEYQYTHPVYLEAQVLHLKPCSDARQTLKEFDLKITPTPSLITEIIDVAGNPAHEVWFRGTCSEMTIEAHSTVDTLMHNPFNYLLRESSLSTPVSYPDILKKTLLPYHQTGAPHPDIEAMAQDANHRARHNTTHFLSELCLMIYQRINYIHREEGFPWAPEKTLKEGKGSCRDTAVLFNACCNAVGIASRFTSGYVFDTEKKIGTDLHAWSEVYLEGGGWRGYDPSTGLAVNENYITLASAQDARIVTPIMGNFRSNSAVASLRKLVSIHPE